MDRPQPNSPSNPSTDGVSPKIKFLVILLTVVTVCAFGWFSLKLFQKIGSPQAKTEWSEEWLTVGQRLENAGLKKQAAEHYSHYLKSAKMNQSRRAEVSFTTGQLYIDLEDCESALPWLYHAELAARDPQKKATVSTQIQLCKNKLNHPAT